MAGLIHKLVQPRKVVSSRGTNQVRFDKFLVAKAEGQMGTANTAVLRKTDAAEFEFPCHRGAPINPQVRQANQGQLLLVFGSDSGQSTAGC